MHTPDWLECKITSNKQQLRMRNAIRKSYFEWNDLKNSIFTIENQIFQFDCMVWICVSEYTYVGLWISSFFRQLFNCDSYLNGILHTTEMSRKKTAKTNCTLYGLWLERTVVNMPKFYLKWFRAKIPNKNSTESLETNEF